MAIFSYLSFILATCMMYRADSSQPYFSISHYPGILTQPGLNIRCSNLLNHGKDINRDCDTNLLSININKMFNWKPVPYTMEDHPETMKEGLKELEIPLPMPENFIFVTCNGREEQDKENLQGMRVTSLPGFPASGFPWMGNPASWQEPVTLDLSNSQVARSKNNTVVFMECRAWARNIQHTVRFVDRKIPNGGGLAVLCFGGGKIVKIGQKFC